MSRLAGLAAAALTVAPFGVGGHIARSAESTVSNAPPPGSVVPPTLTVNFNGTSGPSERTCNVNFVYDVGGTVTPDEYLAVRAHPADEPAPPEGVWSKLVPVTSATSSGVVVFHGLTRGLGYRYDFTIVGPTAAESLVLGGTTWPIPGWVTASCNAPALG
jgi:hypothetical protein